MRSFIAIDLPSQIISKLARQINEYREKLPPVIRWIVADNIHLTLKFLGEISPQQVESIKIKINAIGVKRKSFDLHIHRNGVFPNWNRPRIIWVGLQSSDFLLTVVEQIENDLSSIGIRSEDRPFSPHITIGRFRDFAKPQEINKIKQFFNNENILDEIFTVTEICLYQSILHPAGPEYICINKSHFNQNS